MLSTMHFESPATAGSAQLTSDAAEAGVLVAAFWNAVRTRMSVSATIRPAVRYVTVDVNPAQLIPAAIPASMVGSGSVNTLPWQTQGIITWQTGGAVRGTQGRTFVPYGTEEDNVSGAPIAAYVTALQGAAQALLDNSALGGVPMILWKPKTLTSLLLVGATARTYWATLRSRRD